MPDFSRVVSNMTKLMTTLLQETKLLNPNITQIIVSGINAIIKPNGTDLPSQQAVSALSAKLSAGLPEIQSTIRQTLIAKFSAPADANISDNDRQKDLNIVTATVNQTIPIGVPIVVSGINAIIKPNGNPSSPDQAICDLKNALNGNLSCIQTGLLNEVNACNIQTIFAYIINNNIMPC
jgi:hypothetical protein